MSDQERLAPPDTGQDLQPAYPGSPNVIVNQLGLDLPCSNRDMENVGLITVVGNDNGTWTVENTSMMDGIVSGTSKRTREDDDVEESNTVKKKSNNIDVASNCREGFTDLRTDVSTETVSEHLPRKNLDGHRGKVFKDVIIASASSKIIFSNPKLTRDLLVYRGFSAFIENGFEGK